MGTLRLKCNRCRIMEHWLNDKDLPNSWGYRLDGLYIWKYPDYLGLDPKNLYCSDYCYSNDI